MRILIVSATTLEIAPLVANLQDLSTGNPRMNTYTHAGHDLDVMTTGVGMVATSAWCSLVLAQEKYDLSLNLGVCGSFDRTLEPGTVVQVISDRIAEQGAEHREDFVTIHELKLVGENEFPFTSGRLMNAKPPASATLSGLPAATGITVNTVHGNRLSIEKVTERFSPHVESMEGAAFMYACLIHEVPFAQVRAVSNFVEPRNREAWKMPEAIAALSETALQILDDL